MPLANMPNVRTQIAFGSTWATSTPATWTDVSAYVRNISVSRGRASDLDKFDAGTATVTLSNRDGRFNPMNTSGPYYGTLTPRRPIRVLGNYPIIAGATTVASTGTGDTATLRSTATLTDDGLVLNGTSDYANTPFSANNDLTGNIDMRAEVTPTSWTSTTQAVFGKWSIDSKRSYLLTIRYGTAPFIAFSYSQDGVTSYTINSANMPSFSARQTVWVRARVTVGTPLSVDFFYSYNGLDWISLGTVTGTGVASLNSNNQGLTIGRYDGTTPGFYFAGTINRVQLFQWAGSTFTQRQDTMFDTSYPVFNGYVQTWPQDFPAVGKDAVTTIQAVDALGLLGGLTVPVDDITARIASGELPAPTAWWRLGDTNTGVFVDYSGNGKNLTTTGTLNTSSSIVPSQSWSSTQFNGTQTSTGLLGAAGYSAYYSVSLWIKTTQVGSGSNYAALFTTTTAPDQRPFRLGIDSSGFVHATSFDFNPGFVPDHRSSVTVNDGNVHHVVYVGNGTSSRIYVDGVDVTVTLNNVPGGSGPTATIGSTAVTTATGGTDIAYNGTMQEVVYWYNTALTGAQVTALYNAGTTRTVETSGVRFTRLLNSVNWPANRSRTTAASGTCQTLTYNGENALQKLQEVETTEGGTLFAAADGMVVLLDRYYPQASTSGGVSQATFGDDSGVGYRELKFRWDADQLVNDVTVTSATGVPSRYTVSTSITNYGQRSRALSTLLATNEAADMAGALATQFAEPLLRAEPFQVRPQTAPTTMWPAVLPLDLGYRITLRYQPLGMTNRIVQQLFIQAISHDITPDEWVVTIMGSPRAIYEFFTLDVSQLDSKVLGY